MAAYWTLTGDAIDPPRLAAFWKRALGYVDEQEYDFADGAALVDPDGKLPALSFRKVPEGKTAKNRLHIDIRVAPEGSQVDPDQRDQLIRAKSAELVAAGATVVHENRWEGHVTGVVDAGPRGQRVLRGVTGLLGFLARQVRSGAARSAARTRAMIK